MGKLATDYYNALIGKSYTMSKYKEFRRKNIAFISIISFCS